MTAVAFVLPGAVSAQDGTFGIRPPRWTIELDAGTRLPGTIYNEFLERRHPNDRFGPLRTRWREDNKVGFDGRLTLRFRPESGAGIYVAGIYGTGGTDAFFSGSSSPPEEISRDWRYVGLDFGLTLKLKDWNRGRGLIEYALGAVVLQQTIDLENGHRDPFAIFPESNLQASPPFDWTSRSFTNWGLSLAASFRIPVTEGLYFRSTFRNMIVPVNTADLSTEEQAEVFDISNERAQFSFRPYTAHHLSVSVGLEYTLSWGRARREITRRIPGGQREMDVDDTVVNAMRLAAEGDTAAAITALEARVAAEPQDGFAWRELALLRSGRAEYDPSVRDEVLATLERALNMNPGDTELLRAYGRVRGLIQREGRRPDPEERDPLALSGLALEADDSGRLQLAWAVRGLQVGDDGRYHYQVEIEAFRDGGTPVPLRSGLDEFDVRDDGTLVRTGATDALPATLDASVFLVNPEPGIHTVRVWVTDLETGQRIETSESATISGG